MSNIPELKNIKTIVGNNGNYFVTGNDDVINVDTSAGGLTLIIPNIANSKLQQFYKSIYINDIGNNASVNNIRVVTIGIDTINGSPYIDIDINNASVILELTGLTTWLADFGTATSPANADEKVKVSSTDALPEFLQNKLVAGSGINFNVLNLLGVEKIQVSSTGGSSDINYSNVLFVDPIFGNDLTALAGRFDRPFLSITAATTMAAAMGGSLNTRNLIYIRKGTYGGNVNLTAWTDFYCEAGVVFVGGGNVRDQGIAVISNFFGYAKFRKITQALFITGNSTVNFEFDTIDNTFGQALRIEPPAGGECNINIVGNSIFSTTGGVGYAIALRRKCNVTLNIKNFIRAYHSLIDIRDNYDGITVVNCPKLILDENNFFGGNFKQCVIMYGATANGRITINGDLINRMPSFLGGIAGMITNWSSTNGTIELNGNIYAGKTYGLFGSGNQLAGKSIINGSIYSEIQAIFCSSVGSYYVRNGVINKTDPIVGSTIALNQNAKLFISNSFINNEQPDGDLINVINVTNILNLYNVCGESSGLNGFAITSANVVVVKLHNFRSNKPLSINISDALSPTGFIFDPLVTIPKF